jgi:hypothetical protein
LPDGDRAGVQVHVADGQVQRFGQTQTGHRNQPEQRAIGQWPKARIRREALGRLQQLHDFLVCVDVRHEPPVPSAQDARRRDLSGRLELAVVRSEGPHNLQPPRSHYSAGPQDVLACPAEDQFLGQRAEVVTCIGVAREAHQLGRRSCQLISQLPAILQVLVHGRRHRVAAAHSTLLGQGIATARRRTKSTLA